MDAPFHGRERKLLLHANRNGFFYVLDRTNGKFLQGTAFVKKLSWASGIDKVGRPIELPGNDPTEGGVKTLSGGTRRDQLVLDGFQPPNPALLRDGFGGLHDLS